MLTILRKIRRSLLASGAVRKYLLYAIGEIALVVIGIMIALKINSWNEWKTDRIKEKGILIDLKENLDINKNLLKVNIAMHKDHNASAQVIIDAITKSQVYEDSLKVHFHKARIQVGGTQYLSNIGYVALGDAGFDIISNKSLKDDILYLFEVTYSSNIETLKWFAQIDPFREKNLYDNFINDAYGSLMPIDYERLLDDQYYISMIIALQGQRRYWNNLLNECLKETERVLQLIEEGLGETDGGRVQE